MFIAHFFKIRLRKDPDQQKSLVSPFTLNNYLANFHREKRQPLEKGNIKRRGYYLDTFLGYIEQ